MLSWIKWISEVFSSAHNPPHKFAKSSQIKAEVTCAWNGAPDSYKHKLGTYKSQNVRWQGRIWIFKLKCNMETYNTIYKSDSQWEFAVWLRELKQGLSNRLKGEVGRAMEGGLGGRVHGCTYGWFLLMYDRKPQNSVKQLSFN